MIPSVILRMEAELQEVTDRKQRADAYVLTETFKTTPIVEQHLFYEQIEAMGKYARSLGKRLSMVKARNNIR